MIAVDTNILVRFLVTDDPRQSAAAKALFAANRIAVAHTVLLESEWVLRRGFRSGREQIAGAFRRLLSVETVFCGRRDAVLHAITAFEGGCDFADALHAATAHVGVAAFATFDAGFVSRAAYCEGFPCVRLLSVEDGRLQGA